MSDLISRKMAIEALGEEPMVWNDDDAFALGERNQWECDVEAIKGVPSAQPEIIRCKDCKYRYLDGMIWNCPFGLSGGEDFFCAYGAIGGGSGT